MLKSVAKLLGVWLQEFAASKLDFSHLPRAPMMTASDGKVTIYMRQSVLDSDEAITAVMAHETHEIEGLRIEFANNGGKMRASQFRDLVSDTAPYNLHSEAVDLGDQLVREMRARNANGGKFK